MDVDIGSRLRAERQRHGLSLRELAERVGVSASMLSQVETGRSQASVSTLYSLVSELGISLDDLFALGPGRAEVDFGPVPPRRSEPVFKAKDRARIELETGVVWERLANVDPDVLQFMQVTYPPGGRSSRSGRYSQHAGLDCGYVLAGRLTLHLGFDTHVLEPGDVTLFDAAEPHLLENTGTEDARAIWFIYRGEEAI
ncbi:helix-turn-helix domain-containing protein [Pseudonocardia acaciae]|uniref:helix-turn-helix domain-containing protein n=1 Tax=Pseudonocardia acaciae TaxID=551276 RepID=UPI00048FED0A|nr:helix-turn-helix domain-containing protein [Pseudonocardia acaciae]